MYVNKLLFFMDNT